MQANISRGPALLNEYVKQCHIQALIDSCKSVAELQQQFLGIKDPRVFAAEEVVVVFELMLQLV